MSEVNITQFLCIVVNVGGLMMFLLPLVGVVASFLGA